MDNLKNYYQEDRPWGGFERFTQNEKTTVKLLTVKPHEQLSLQTHELREEFWKIISGSGIVTVGEEEHEATAGDTFYVPLHAKHRIKAHDAGLLILEIAFGEFEENDIVRLEDKYHRGQPGATS